MKNFNDIYERVYKECNEELETLRKKSRNETIIVLIMFMLIGIILTKLLKYEIFLTISLGLIIIYLAKSKKRMKYNLAFKEEIIKTFVKEYSENLDYRPLRGIDRATYIQAEFEGFDNYDSEDLISGILEGGYHINMGEVKTERESTDSDGDRTTYTLFHGVFANIKLDKTLNSIVKIRKNATPLLFKRKQKLEMDSGEFEKVYNVYTTDKIIAMQILTADVMQMLLDFKENNKITPEITIKGNNFYIRFPVGEVFEGSFIKSALDYGVLKKYFDIINFTLSLIESFSKNISETEV